MLKPVQLLFDFVTGRSEPMVRDLVPLAAPEKKAPTLPPFQIIPSPRRRTLGVEVHRDLSVIVRAPLGCPDDLVRRYLNRQRRWITRQLDYFKALPPPRPHPRYVEGEAHLYLGREYQLALQPERRSQVLIDGERLIVGGIGASDPSVTEAALSRWYLARARLEFINLLSACHAHPRFARYGCPSLRVRNMRTRWGSLCRARGMTLNAVLIQAPRECIEYVIFHELCHLSYHGHGARFYQLLSAVAPEWEARKRQLETTITW